MEELAEKLQNDLEDYGISIGENPDRVFNKCAELCPKYDITSEQFVESWLAFAATKSIVELNERELDVFEKQNLSTLKEKAPEKSFTLPSSSFKTDFESKVQVFGVADDESDVEFDADANDVLEVYGLNSTYNGTPKVEKKSAVRLRTNAGDTPKGDFSPAGYSPAVQAKSATYNVRIKAGDSVLRYKCKDSEYWNDIPKSSSPVQVFPVQSTKDIITSGNVFKYLFQKATDAASTLNAVIEDLGIDMLDDTDREPQDLRKSSVAECWYLGKIRNDDGRLSQANTYLEGDLEISGGHVMSVDLSDAEEYRLFPGQVVMLKGTNELGKCLRVSEIVVPSPLPLPTVLPTTRPLNVIVASGPYTPTDSLLYEPLKDLMEVIERDKPDLCILMGPFIDPSHPLIIDGEMAETFEDLFEDIIEKRILGKLKNVCTRLILVPSFKDAHHHMVYPTPQYSVPVKFSNKISVLPDPSIVEVAGITIGLTSVDILKHLGNSEISKNTITDRMGGLSKQILTQRNFYPLYPPDDSVPFDIHLWTKYCRFSNTPHILILPSDLRHFIKEVDGTIVVNPERLTKGMSGGTYVRLQVKLPDSLHEDVKSVADFCCGEILKI